MNQAMDAASLLIGLTTVSCLGLALQVHFRSERTPVARAVRALLAQLS